MERDKWIVDSSASVHVCGNADLLMGTYPFVEPVRIHLLNGSSRLASYAGRTQINKDLILHKVLYIPEFTHNLISVARLI